MYRGVDPTPRVCEYCGQDYYKPKGYNQKIWAKRKYCSKDCQLKATAERLTKDGIPPSIDPSLVPERKVCPGCGEWFERDGRRPSLWITQRYCSRQCFQANRAFGHQEEQANIAEERAKVYAEVRVDERPHVPFGKLGGYMKLAADLAGPDILTKVLEGDLPIDAVFEQDYRAPSLGWEQTYVRTGKSKHLQTNRKPRKSKVKAGPVFNIKTPPTQETNEIALSVISSLNSSPDTSHGSDQQQDS